MREIVTSPPSQPSSSRRESTRAMDDASAPSPLGGSPDAIDARDEGAMTGDELAARDMRLRGVRVTYFDVGDVGAPAVLLLHALGANRRRWTPLARALRAHRRVIALDFPGFGDSERVALDAREWTYERLAETALDLVSALGLGRVALVGHSMGAGAAIVAAADRPEFVERLVLVSPPCAPSTPSIGDRLARAPLVGRALFRRVVGSAAMLRRGVHERDWSNAAEATWAMLRHASDPSTLLARLPRLRAPTLIVWGREDRVTSWTLGTRVAREVGSGARLEIFECGHTPEIERADAFCALVDAFLNVPTRAGATSMDDARRAKTTPQSPPRSRPARR